MVWTMPLFEGLQEGYVINDLPSEVRGRTREGILIDLCRVSVRVGVKL